MTQTHEETLLNLLPPVSYARNAPRHRMQAKADAAALDDVLRVSQRVLDVVWPDRSGEMIADWERVLGLDNAGKPYAQRVAAVLLKINATGGLSIPYFVQLAKSAGYTITIDEPQPFRVGINRAGDRLAGEDIMWVWTVNVQSSSQTVYRFRAGSGAAGERLSTYADAVIESVFNDLKPAHTAVRYTYKDN